MVYACDTTSGSGNKTLDDIQNLFCLLIRYGEDQLVRCMGVFGVGSLIGSVYIFDTRMIVVEIDTRTLSPFTFYNFVRVLNMFFESEIIMNRILLRLIATLQIAGASASALVVFPQVFDVDFSLGKLLVIFVMFAIFGISFVSGIWLWNGEVRGRRLSMIVHALQIPILISTVLIYQFVFGIGILIKILGHGQDIYFEFGATSNLHLFSYTADFQVGINIWSLCVFLYLWKTRVSRNAIVVAR